MQLIAISTGLANSTHRGDFRFSVTQAPGEKAVFSDPGFEDVFSDFTLLMDGHEHTYTPKDPDYLKALNIQVNRGRMFASVVVGDDMDKATAIRTMKKILHY